MAPVNYNLSQITAALQTQWGGSDNGTTRWWREADRIIEYSLPSTVPTRADGEQTGFRAMTSTESSYARLAFDLWDDLIAWDLTEVNNTDAQITMAMSSSTAGGGTYATDFLVAQPPGSSTFERDIERQRIWLNTGWQDFQNGNFDYGERGLETMLHEIGHTLGLSHPGPYDATDVPAPTYADDALYTQDTLQWTIMSYWAPNADGTVVDRIGTAQTLDGNGDGVNAATPLLHDIMAIQARYGADMTTRAGNDTYGFNASFSGEWRPVFDFGSIYNPDPVIAIWDANGIDTLDVSGYTQNQRIDLAPGAISDVGALTQNVAIAYGAIIENARGGTGADTIRGNHVDNYLFGGAGVDTIEGFDGNDTLDQWHDGGWMYGGNGQDILWSGNGGDYMDGGDGIDRAVFSRSPAAIAIDLTIGKVLGGDAQGDTLVSIEDIVASAHDDNIRMGGGDNAIWAGDGQDQVEGGSGGDRLFGEGGNDVLVGGHGRWVGDLYYIGDEINGGDGFDTAVFNSAVTIDLRPGGIHGGEAQGDTFISIEQFTGSSERDFFYGSNFNDRFQGRGEGDYMNGGGGNDTASYADRTSGITVQMSFNNLEPGDEFRPANEIAGRTDGKVSPADGTWIDTLISMETIEGTNFDDLFLGDERANTFYGLGGNDSFEGDADGTPQGSWDDMYGGSGNDTFVVGINDLANGGADNDTATFVGGALFLDFVNFNFTIGGTAIHVQEIETYIGTDFSDTVYGANYGETINLGAGGQDYANGNGGNDFLYTSDGFDTLIGGDGFDTIVFHRSMVASWQTGQLDSAIAESWASWEAIQGASGDDIIRTNDWGYAVELRGGAGNDILAAGPGQVISDTLRGEAGNDTLDGGAGNDTLDGGADTDTVDYSRATQQVVVDLPSNIARGGQIGIDTLSSMENVRTGSGNDAVAGNGAVNVLDGGAGTDTVSYYAASRGVVLDLAGQSGVDGTSTDTLLNFENANGTRFNDAISGTAAANVLNGLGGIDTISYYLSTQGVLIDLAGNVAIQGGITDTILNFENATGSRFNDSISGNAGANVLDGLGGIDTLSYYASPRGLVIDLASSLVVDGAVRDNVRNFENVNATNQNDAVAGTAAANVLNGLGGIDTISYFASAQAVTINLSAGTGVSGGVTDTLLNFENANGSAYADNITGNGGANVLNGLSGIDTLTGGGGFDTFEFRTGQANGDVIIDFTGNGAAAGDTIRLVGFGTATQGATFTQLNATQWQIHSGLDQHNEIITLSNGATVQGTDFFFV